MATNNSQRVSLRDRILAGASGSQVAAAILSWLVVTLEGFELVTLGAIIPTFLDTKYLGMTVADTAFIATVSLVGVGLGASIIGIIADKWGRRVAVMGSVLVFSIFTLLQPLSLTPLMFAGLRFFAGMGLGAVMPAALAVMAEVTPPAHRAKATTVIMTGYHVGAVAASLAAIAVLPHWQWLFWIGAAIGFALLPVMWFMLPESKPVVAEGAVKVPASELLRPTYRKTSIGLWIGSFMGLLLVYGMLTWLPQIMKAAGYSLSNSLVMLFLLNVGAVIGLLFAGWVGDNKGIKPSIQLWFLVSAVFLTLLSIKMTSTVLLNVVVFVTGLFVFSAQSLIYALTSHLYHQDIRATALGLTSGIGRLGAILGPVVTGPLVAMGMGHPWGFYLFAAVAVLGFIAISFTAKNPPVVENRTHN